MFYPLNAVDLDIEIWAAFILFQAFLGSARGPLARDKIEAPEPEKA